MVKTITSMLLMGVVVVQQLTIGTLQTSLKESRDQRAQIVEQFDRLHNAFNSLSDSFDKLRTINTDCQKDLIKIIGR